MAINNRIVSLVPARAGTLLVAIAAAVALSACAATSHAQAVKALTTVCNPGPATVQRYMSARTFGELRAAEAAFAESCAHGFDAAAADLAHTPAEAANLPVSHGQVMVPISHGRVIKH